MLRPVGAPPPASTCRPGESAVIRLAQVVGSRRGSWWRPINGIEGKLSHLIEAYSGFNNSGSGRVAVQTMNNHNHQRSDSLHACARIVFDHSRRFRNNFAAALN